MTQYTVDAFTGELFCGNPAAINILDRWPEKALMMKISRENNLSETAFAVPEGEGYRLRWFTPGGEIDLCGHATLAAAHVILRFYRPGDRQVTFETLSGKLTVTAGDDGTLEMEFPAYVLRPVPVTDQMEQAMGARPREAWMGRDLLCVFDDEETVRRMQPDLDKVRGLDGLLLQVTAPGKDYTCVSRTFAPKLAVPEDPVCGSGHCHIVPYWAERLGREDILAFQTSPRTGVLSCRRAGERVFLAGKAVLYAKAELFV